MAENEDPEFGADLYRGVAELYDEFRLPYAPALINQLLDDTTPDGRGRALDLGCGPGLLAFALAGVVTDEVSYFYDLFSRPAT